MPLSRRRPLLIRLHGPCRPPAHSPEEAAGWAGAGPGDTLESLIKRLIVNHVHQYLGRGPGTRDPQDGGFVSLPEGQESPGIPETQCGRRRSEQDGRLWDPPVSVPRWGRSCPGSTCPSAATACRADLPAGRQGWPVGAARREARGHASSQNCTAQPGPRSLQPVGRLCSHLCHHPAGASAEMSASTGVEQAGPVSTGEHLGGLVLRTAALCHRHPRLPPASFRLQDLNVSVPAGRGGPRGRLARAQAAVVICSASPPGLPPGRLPQGGWRGQE